MKYRLELPEGKNITIRYSDKVYNPRYSMVDTIVVADRLVRGKGRLRCLDVACGSGVVGLGLKYLNPDLDMTLGDISEAAVKQTRINAKQLGLNVTVRRMDLTGKEGYDLITANLPTYDSGQMSLDLHGPEEAFAGGADGMDLYRRLFEEARCRALVCECQKKHQERFLEIAKERGWRLLLRTDFGFAFVPATLNTQRSGS